MKQQADAYTQLVITNYYALLCHEAAQLRAEKGERWWLKRPAK